MFFSDRFTKIETEMREERMRGEMGDTGVGGVGRERKRGAVAERAMD